MESPTEAEPNETTRQDTLRKALAHRPLLIGFIYSMVRDFSLADKLFQDLCVTICDRWHTETDNATDFAVWSVKLARNRVQATLRVWNEMGRDSVQLPPAHLIDALEDLIVERSKHQSFPIEKSRNTLRVCLKTLPRHLREVLDLSYVKNLSARAIASKLGQEVETIAQALHEARIELQTCLNKRLSQQDCET